MESLLFYADTERGIYVIFPQNSIHAFTKSSFSTDFHQFQV